MSERGRLGCHRRKTTFARMNWLSEMRTLRRLISVVGKLEAQES